MSNQLPVSQILKSAPFDTIHPRLLDLWKKVYNESVADEYKYANRLYILPGEFLIENDFRDLLSFAESTRIVKTDWIRFLFTDKSDDLKDFGIHIDGSSQGIQKFVLNFPIINAEKSVTEFYKITEGEPIFEDKHICLDQCKFEFFDSMIMKTGTPYILRTHLPHRMTNQDGGLRVIAGWGIKDDLEWEDIPKVFGDSPLMLDSAL